MMRFVVLLACVGLIACDDSIVPEQQIVARFPPEMRKGTEYIVPDTVVVNVPFEVIVYPALGCGSDAIAARVSISGTTADVTARALIPRHVKGAVFTCEGRLLNKSVGVVTFARVGPALVRLHGRTMVGERDTTIAVPVVVRQP